MQKRLFTIILMVAVSGCANQVNLNDVITSWKGSHIDVAIKEWGHPTKENIFLGHKFYVWELDERKLAESRSWMKWDGPSFDNYCKCILEVDDKNIITDGQLDGDGCP